MLNLKIITLIIEKDKQSLVETFAVLKKFNELSIVAKTTSGKRGLTLVNKFVPQLIFINTELADINGLEFVSRLRNSGVYFYVVFLAKNEKHALKSLPLEPFDYFVKPLKPSLVLKMIKRLKLALKKDELNRRMDEFIKKQEVATKRIFHQKNGIIVLKLEEIVFCKAQRASTTLKMSTGENVFIKTKIGETLEVINSKSFIRTGRSYYINCEYLRKIDKKSLKCVLYHEGQTWEIPVSKNTIRVLEKLNVQPIC